MTGLGMRLQTGRTARWSPLVRRRRSSLLDTVLVVGLVLLSSPRARRARRATCCSARGRCSREALRRRRAAAGRVPGCRRDRWRCILHAARRSCTTCRATRSRPCCRTPRTRSSFRVVGDGRRRRPRGDPARLHPAPLRAVPRRRGVGVVGLQRRSSASATSSRAGTRRSRPALLGAIWGCIYLVRRSIVAPMVSHAGFNLLQLIKFVALR